MSVIKDGFLESVKIIDEIRAEDGLSSLDLLDIMMLGAGKPKRGK